MHEFSQYLDLFSGIHQELFFILFLSFFSLLIDWFKTTQGPVFQWKAAHRLGR
jgi:hypothetical protein